ncbi:MAG: TIGR00159 family protein, partial [Elusimicrobia bacterium]|nr:TIGR00159 family protein [Elusimicrobiota bacterium]
MDILRNIIDISITAYIIYWLIRLIQGTRAMHVVWGVIILSLLTLFSKVFNLNATAWLFQQFWVAGIVLLIVVFQPEIRSGLAELGSRPLGRMIGSRELDFIKELMEAARYCSEVRMGLLVVLEQEMGLRDIVNTGTRVNGEV